MKTLHAEILPAQHESATGSDDPVIGFDLGVRNTALQGHVAGRLEQLGIAHEMLPDGFMMVPASAEVHVDEVIEAVHELVLEADAPAFGAIGLVDLVGAAGSDEERDAHADAAEAVAPESERLVTSAEGVAVVAALAEAAEALCLDPRAPDVQKAILVAVDAFRSLSGTGTAGEAGWPAVLGQCDVVVALIEDAGEEPLVEREAELLISMVTAGL